MSPKFVFSFSLLIVLLSSLNVQNSEAVINGQNAEAGEFPFIVDVRNHTTPDTAEKAFCGGTLVTRRHVVTSIYCVSTMEHLLDDGPVRLLKPENVKVFVGSLAAHTGDVYEAEELFFHPDYDVTITITLNDIAVIKLKEEVTTPNIETIALPTIKPEIGQAVSVAGWGCTDEARENPASELQKYTLKVSDTEDCRAKWEALGTSYSIIYNHIESDKIFCALPDESGTRAGFGDIGGPAVIDGQYVGIPLLSEPGLPEIFTSVGAHKQFIENIINSD